MPERGQQRRIQRLLRARQAKPRIPPMRSSDEALFGGEQRPFAVDVDRSALEHDGAFCTVEVRGGLPSVDAEPRRDALAGSVVELMVVVARPAVEVPLDRGELARGLALAALDHERRHEIARP